MSTMIHPPFNVVLRLPRGKKKRGLAPTSPTDRWGPVGVVYRPNPSSIPEATVHFRWTNRPNRASGGSVVVCPAQRLLPGLLHVDRTDAVVELRHVGVDLGIGVVGILGDGPGEAVLLVEAGDELGDGRVPERRVVLEHVAELAGERSDGGSGIVVRHRRSP